MSVHTKPYIDLSGALGTISSPVGNITWTSRVVVELPILRTVIMYNTVHGFGIFSSSTSIPLDQTLDIEIEPASASTFIVK